MPEKRSPNSTAASTVSSTSASEPFLQPSIIVDASLFNLFAVKAKARDLVVVVVVIVVVVVVDRVVSEDATRGILSVATSHHLKTEVGPNDRKIRCRQQANQLQSLLNGLV